MDQRKEIYELIKNATSIVIFGHLSPDGDCYGSQIGLKEAIKETFKDKKVYAVGTGLPNLYNRLAKLDNVSDDIIKESLGIIVDANVVSRLEDQRITLAKKICKIDHHLNEKGFDLGPEFVNVEAIATAEIITDFIIDYKMRLNKLGAEALFLGIVTDSGRFLYGSTNLHTFETVTYLCRFGVEAKSIYDIIYAQDEKSIRLKGYIMANYKTSNGVAYITFSKKQLAKLDVDFNKAASMLNVLANIKGLPIWASFAESKEGKTRVELRSNGPAVQPVAVKYGGGGHLQASGIALLKFDKKIIKNIIHDLSEVINK